MIQRSKPQAGGLPWVLWALLIILAAVVGGLAAAAVVHVASRWISVALPAVIGLAVALASRREGSWQPGEQGHALPGAEGGRQSAADAGRSGASTRTDRPIASGLDRAGSPAVAQVHRVSPSPEGDTPWWVAAGAAQPQAGAEASTVPAADLSSYLASALIAQCPRCGAFDLDIKRGATRWTCRCDSCGQAWTWQPGTAWPQVRVSPRRRTQRSSRASDTHYRQD